MCLQYELYRVLLLYVVRCAVCLEPVSSFRPRYIFETKNCTEFMRDYRIHTLLGLLGVPWILRSWSPKELQWNYMELHHGVQHGSSMALTNSSVGDP